MSGGQFVRYVDVIENPGVTPRTVNLQIAGNLGSNSATVLTADSSGDTLFGPMDTYFATDDAELDFAGAAVEISYSAVNVTAGFRYSFR